MGNLFQQVGHGIAVGAKDVSHAVVAVVDFLPRAAEVLDECITQQPQVKAEVLQLIQLGTAVVGSGASAAADKGVNLTQDAATLAAAESFFAYFRDTFCPLIAEVYKTLKTDATTPATTT